MKGSVQPDHPWYGTQKTDIAGSHVGECRSKRETLHCLEKQVATFPGGLALDAAITALAPPLETPSTTASGSTEKGDTHEWVEG